MTAARRVILCNKPYGFLSQFTDTEGRSTLADLLSAPGFYPAGRLDRTSEGLLVLTDDGGLRSRITAPEHKLPKTYWVQVHGIPTARQMRSLREGIELKEGRTRPAEVRLLARRPSDLWPRAADAPTRRQPASWLEFVLREGKNRQIRRMAQSVDLPVQRLVRVRVGPWSVGDLQPGAYRFEAQPRSLRMSGS